jgi:hypothetical protein
MCRVTVPEILAAVAGPVTGGAAAYRRPCPDLQVSQYALVSVKKSSYVDSP